MRPLARRRLGARPNAGMMVPVVALLVLALCAGGMAVAGGPLLVNGAGEPLAWDTSLPIPYHPDQGTLGQLDEAAALILVQDSFAIWEAAPVAGLTFTAGASLPCDVDQVNFTSCGAAMISVLGNGTDGLSPVIYDTDGLLMNAIFGAGARDDIIGFAAVVGGSYQPPVVTEGEAVINGLFFDGIDGPGNPELASQAAFQVVMVHEIGHWLNLDHAQINVQFAADGDPANDVNLPTMFPTATDDDTQLLTLNVDDLAALGSLYPAPGLDLVTARLSGTVLSSSGAPFQGANLVLRSVLEPELLAYSAISGARYFPAPPFSSIDPVTFGGPPPAALEGLFEFGAVAPGTYILEIEEVDPFFAGGSAVGPFNIPVFVPGPDEFWNGVSESSDPAVDDPAAAAPLALAAGAELTEINIHLNTLPPPALLYAVDDQPFDAADPTGPGTIIELDLASGQILRRIPAPELDSALHLPQGLAYSPSRASLFFTDAFASGQIFEINPFPDPADGIAGKVLNILPHPLGAGDLDGLAFLDGPGQPAGGRLYAMDSDTDMVLALDPDTGVEDTLLTVLFNADLFGGLAGGADDLFATSFDGFIFHFRPGLPEPLLDLFPAPDLDIFILGLAYDGQSVYGTSVDFLGGFPIWRLAARVATDDPSQPSTRLDVLSRQDDPTPIASFGGGFVAAAAALRGDINGSLRVDGFDLAGLARAFGSSAPQPGFRTAADLDRDDDVDGTDLAILAAYFGGTLLPGGP